MSRVAGRPAFKSRPGVALFAALGTMLLVSLLVVGGLASAGLAQRAAAGAQANALLSPLADDALAGVVADWAAQSLDTLSIGATAQLPSGGATASHARVTVTALPYGVYWLVAEAWSDADSLARRRTSLVVARPHVLNVPPSTILSAGDLEIGAGVTVSVAPDAGATGCPGPALDLALPPAAALAVLSSSDTNGVRVRAMQLGTADSALYWPGDSALRPLDRTAALLAGGAHLTLAGQTDVHAAGDLTLDGGVGSGLIVADGTLHVSGSVSFTGLLLARGGADLRGGPATLTGVLISGGPTHVQGMDLRYSACEARDALARAVPPRPTASRARAQLFEPP